MPENVLNRSNKLFLSDFNRLFYKLENIKVIVNYKLYKYSYRELILYLRIRIHRIKCLYRELIRLK